jgi:hypothetical protein
MSIAAWHRFNLPLLRRDQLRAIRLHRNWYQRLVVFAEQSQAAWNGNFGVLRGLQDIYDVSESVENVVASIEQVLVPFV